MSTRATILVKDEDEEVRIYHHCDGYPDGIGSDMKAYLKDVKYWSVEDIANDLIKGKCGSYEDWRTGKQIPDDGYEWTSCIHGDEEFYYVIDCVDKALHCYEDEGLKNEVVIPDKK